MEYNGIQTTQAWNIYEVFYHDLSLGLYFITDFNIGGSVLMDLKLVWIYGLILY